MLEGKSVRAEFLIAILGMYALLHCSHLTSDLTISALTISVMMHNNHLRVCVYSADYYHCDLYL